MGVLGLSTALWMGQTENSPALVAALLVASTDAHRHHADPEPGTLLAAGKYQLNSSPVDLRFSDGTMVSVGSPAAEFQKLHQLTGKPIIICDFAIRFKDGDKAIRGYEPMATAEAAGANADYLCDAMATPLGIGAFRCNLIDSSFGFKATGVKQDLFEKGLTPRPTLHKAIRELNH